MYKKENQIKRIKPKEEVSYMHSLSKDGFVSSN